MPELAEYHGIIKAGHQFQIEGKPYLQNILTFVTGQVYLAYTNAEVIVIYDPLVNQSSFAIVYDHRQAFDWTLTIVQGPAVYSDLEKQVHSGLIYYYGARYVTYDSTDVSGSVGVSGSVDITATKAIPVSGTVTIETDKALDVNIKNALLQTHFDNVSIGVTAGSALPVHFDNTSIGITTSIPLDVNVKNTIGINGNASTGTLDIHVTGQTGVLNTNLQSIGPALTPTAIGTSVPISGTVSTSATNVTIESYSDTAITKLTGLLQSSLVDINITHTNGQQLTDNNAIPVTGCPVIPGSNDIGVRLMDMLDDVPHQGLTRFLPVAPGSVVDNPAIFPVKGWYGFNGVVSDDHIQHGMYTTPLPTRSAQAITGEETFEYIHDTENPQ